MSIIPCTSNCKYQQNGACSLKQALSVGTASDSGCIHYIPKDAAEYSHKEIKKMYINKK